MSISLYNSRKIEADIIKSEKNNKEWDKRSRRMIKLKRKLNYKEKQ